MGKIEQKEKNLNTKNINTLDRILNCFEVIGNKLPDPVSIFLILCISILIISFICSKIGVAVEHPLTHNIITAENLLNKGNLKQILMSMVTVFQTYPPLGVVLVAMIGIGLADKSGFLECLLTVVVKKVPSNLIYFTVVIMGLIFTGIGDAGFIVLPPLAALIFLNLGKNPIVGMLLSFAGAAIGFCSGLFVSLNDILLTSFTIPAAQLLSPTFTKSPAMTLYFNITNSILQIFVIAWVTVKFIEPRFPAPEKKVGENEGKEMLEVERKGLRYAGISFLIYMILIVFLAIGKGAFLKDDAGSLVSTKSPLMAGLIPIMALAFFIPGLVFRKITGKIKNDKDVVKMISQTLGEMGGYIFIVFVSAQFLSLFSKSNLGIIMAIKGADGIRNLGLEGMPLLVAYIFLVAFINIFIGSASAKWAILSPVFVPMFMLLGYDPSLTQMAYRIGDASTNMLSPLFPYLPLVLAVARKYDKNFGIGTLIANMIPYSIITLIASIILLTVFFTCGLPFGL